jgi:hypothetical protein
LERAFVERLAAPLHATAARWSPTVQLPSVGTDGSAAAAVNAALMQGPPPTGTIHDVQQRWQREQADAWIAAAERGARS